MKIQARRLLDFSTEQLWDILTGEFTLVFPDGEVKTNYKESLFSSYFWDFHRKYPETPLLTRHHVQSVLKGAAIRTNTHLKLLGTIMWDTYDTYFRPTFDQEQEYRLRDQLTIELCEISNHIYNDLTLRLEEYVTSLDIVDFIEVFRHPRVTEANKTVLPTEESIVATHRVIQEVLADRNSVPSNPISLAKRAGIVNEGQLNQILGPRGFLTDFDSNIFKRPILVGYLEGIRSMYDSLIESRSATKSLIFSKDPLQQAEYFSRKLQLMNQVVRNVHYGDCGSTQYLLWRVRPKRGKMASDLKNLRGKWYMDSDGVLKVIQGNEEHLINKTLKLRMAVNCQHPDPYGICSKCFGDLYYSVPEKTNIGQMCCTSLCQKSTQNVLSVKHYDGSSAVDALEISQDAQRYLRGTPNQLGYLLNEKLRSSYVRVQLVVPADEAVGIGDVLDVDDVTKLPISRVSEINFIQLLLTDKDGLTTDVSIEVRNGKRLASMTYPLLRHIREKGADLDGHKNYVIDLTDFDWSKPILSLAFKHFNMSDHSAEISTKLESRVAEMYDRDKNVSIDAFLVDFFDLVNSKLNVNIAVIDVIVYGIMVVSASDNNYNLPKPGTERGLGVLRYLMNRRSLAATMAYQGHKDVIADPVSYLGTNRMDHPFDSILMPYEVLTLGGKT